MTCPRCNRSDFLARAMLALLLLTPGCRKEGEPGGAPSGDLKPTPPEEPAAEPPTQFEIFKQKCETFTNMAEGYLECDKVPEQARIFMKQSLKEMKEGWVSNKSDAAHELAGFDCDNRLDGLMDAFEVLGCPLPAEKSNGP